MNTTIKKVTKKVPLKKSTSKVLYRFNNRDHHSVSSLIDSIMGYIEEDNENNMDLEDDGLEFEIFINNKNLKFVLSKNRFCCGLLEIGGLSFTLINSNTIKALDADTEKLFADLMDELINIRDGNTLMLTTNGKDISLHFEKVLSKSDSWTAIKSYRNSNSGNIVTIWISNN